MTLKARGMNAPRLAIGDGAMGFWSALEEIYPETRHQRCWLHKTLNVLNAVPKSIQPKVKQALHEIWQAETHESDRIDLWHHPPPDQAIKRLSDP